MSHWDDVQTTFPFHDRIQTQEAQQLPILATDSFVTLHEGKRYLFALVDEQILFTEAANNQWLYYREGNPPVQLQDFAHLFPFTDELDNLDSLHGTAHYWERRVCWNKEHKEWRFRNHKTVQFTVTPSSSEGEESPTEEPAQEEDDTA